MRVQDAIERAREVQSLANARAIAMERMGVTPIGFWMFDDDPGNPREKGVFDASGHENHGTVHGATWVDDAERGMVLSFDGVDDYVSVGTHWNALIGTSDFTIETWVKGGPNTTFRGIVGTYADAATAGLWLDRWESRFRLRIKAAGTPWGSVDVISNPQADNQWHHVVVVGNRDGNGYIYVNGALESQRGISAHSGLISNVLIRIGRLSHTFNGLIDEVRIYNQALTAYQIQYRYAQGLESLLARGIITDKEFQERMAGL